MGFAKPEEFQIESNLSGPERAQNGHTGVEFNPLGWRELAGLKSPTRPDKPRHEVAAAVVFSESVLFERPDSTTNLKAQLFSVGLFLCPKFRNYGPFQPFYVCLDPSRVSIEIGRSTLYTPLFLKKYPELRKAGTRKSAYKSRGCACVR